MHLYLIRHGESVNPNPQATPNAGLTERGQQQSLALARWLRQHVPHIHVLYASPARRAQETAQFLAEAYSCELIFDKHLQESVHSEVESNRERITQFLARLLRQHQDETVVVITHGRTINAFCETLFQVNQRQCNIRLTDTGVCYFQYLDSGNDVPWQLHYLGRVDHLIQLEKSNKQVV